MNPRLVRSKAVALSLVLAGCGDSPTEPIDPLQLEDVVGTYALVAYDGESLPVATTTFTPIGDPPADFECQNVVRSGSLQLRSDFSYVRTLERVIICDNGFAQAYPHAGEHGTFQIDGSILRFVFIDWAESVARYEIEAGKVRIVFHDAASDSDVPHLIYEPRADPELS